MMLLTDPFAGKTQNLFSLFVISWKVLLLLSLLVARMCMMFCFVCGWSSVTSGASLGGGPDTAFSQIGIDDRLVFTLASDDFLLS